LTYYKGKAGVLHCGVKSGIYFLVMAKKIIEKKKKKNNQGI